MMQACKEIKPSKFKKTKIQVKAILVLVSCALEVMLFGGSRSGKTFIFLYAIVVRALKCESRHLVVRRYLNDVTKTIWLDTFPKVIKICFPELVGNYKANNKYNYVTFSNGSEIWFAGLDDADRVEKILGFEFSTIFCNETSQISYNSILVVKTRLAQKNELVNKMYYDQNPPKKKHWTYKTFVLKKNPEDNLKLENPEDFAQLLMNPKDNLDNLDSGYMKILDNLPKSKRARFRDGEYSDDEQGEIFDTADIQRIDKLPADLDRIVEGHDPAVTSKITSDEHGIIICARKGNFGYVIRDSSGIYTPRVAAKKTVHAYHEYECDRIIGEVNNGGDYIETVLRDVDQNISYKAVRATRGKVKRAEPVGALYEQKRIFHVGYFPELEAEMGDFKTDENEMEYSPNRVDAMVWAFTELFNLSHGEPRIRSL